jgi:hypothetical protein
MAESERTQERRAFERRNRPLSCEIVMLGQRHSAVVLDMSNKGLFLRTNAAPPGGTDLEIIVRRAGGELWKIYARVVRAGAADPNAPLLSSRGLGVTIVSAPKDFYDFLESLPD